MGGATVLLGILLSFGASIAAASGHDGATTPPPARAAAPPETKPEEATGPELYLTIRSALRLKSHPVLATVKAIVDYQDPEGAKARYFKSRAWAMERILGPIEAAQHVAGAKPGHAFAILTPETLENEDIKPFFEKRDAEPPKLVAMPLGGGLVLVAKPAPPAAARK